jgi:hypothetical protein
MDNLLGSQMQKRARRIHGTPGRSMTAQSTRSWLWTAIIVQFAGYVFDALWHGVLRPGMEPQTFVEMLRHLATVHLPIYVGAVGLLVTTGLAVLQRLRRRRAGVALRVAFAGALLSTAAEAWHAYSHLHMDTHTGPITGAVSVVGFLVTVTAVWLWRRQ